MKIYCTDFLRRSKRLGAPCIRLCRFSLQAIIRRALRKLHDDVFDLVRVGDLAEDEMFRLAGCLNVYVTEVEYGRNDPFDSGGRILDTGEIELAHLADKETLLFDVDDALIGDNPDVEIVIDPGEKTEEPYKNEKGVFGESKEPDIQPANYFWEQGRQEKDARDEEK